MSKFSVALSFLVTFVYLGFYASQQSCQKKLVLKDYTEMVKQEVRTIKLPSFFIQPCEEVILLSILEYVA